MVRKRTGILYKGMAAAVIFSLLLPMGMASAENLREGERIETEEELRTAVEAAGNGETILRIGADFTITAPVTIRSGQNITLMDDGLPRTLVQKIGSGDQAVFSIEEGGYLTLTTSDGNDNQLILDSAENSSGGYVDCSGRFVLEHGMLRNNFYETAFSGTINIEGENADFIMSGGRITGNQYDNQYGGIIRIAEGAGFTMNGGEISENICNGRQLSNAAVYVESFGAVRFVMNGGLIEKNSGYYGGVFVGTIPLLDRLKMTTAEDHAEMEMNGGTIQNNTAK